MHPDEKKTSAAENDPLPEVTLTPCPAWCQADHGEQLFPEDLKHHSRSREVPAIRWVNTAPQNGRGQATAATVDVVLWKSGIVAPAVTWAYIGNGEYSPGGLELSFDSAVLLLEALTELLQSGD